MKTLGLSPLLAAVSLALLLLPGCEGDDSSYYDPYYHSGNVNGSVSVGVGYYNPWYCGPGCYPPSVIVVPPRGVGQLPSGPHVSPRVR